MTIANGSPLLSLTGISKTFDGVRVLKDAAFELRAGEVHALLGQNGSGKSTLIKILAGYHEPDPGGRMKLRGEEVKLPLSPGEPQHLGIAFVHQDLGLVETLSVADNFAVGGYETRGRWHIDWKAQRRHAQQLLDEFGIEGGTRQDVADVPNQAEKALLAIARAVDTIRRRHESGVIVLDEPTVYLPQTGVDRLRHVIRGLAAKGVGIIYVTHRIDELAGFADRVTVLRDGAVTGTVEVKNVTPRQVVEMILGRAEPLTKQAAVERPEARPDRLLEVRHVSGRVVQDVSLDLHPGEIVGITGLVGMGHEELVNLIFGVEPLQSGTVAVRGKPMRRPSPSRCRDLGIALVPSDRPRRGAALAETAATNISLPVLSSRYFRGGRLRRRQELAEVDRLMREFNVNPANPYQLMSRFSGGNQQKAVLAKWLQMNPSIVLLDEPTQGIDVGAKRDILRRVQQIAASGAGVLISSVEYEDLADLCDRVIVVVDGRVSVELTKGASLTKDSIAAHCYAA